MPTALLDGAEINYQVIGRQGPWVATIPGGRHSLADLEDLAREVASRGYRVLLHDRRNCGLSSLGFDRLEPEDVIWADDLGALLDLLGAGPAFVVGRSRGARVAIRLALRHPRAVRGLLLWGLSGGSLAARFLDEYYYGKYVRACRGGGMDAVCALDHFAGLIEARPENRETLLAIDPLRFLEAMDGWRSCFLSGADRPVMGVGDDELGSLAVPTAIVPYYDRMHPYASTAHAHEMIPHARLFDFDPARREDHEMTEADEWRDTLIVASILSDFESGLR